MAAHARADIWTDQYPELRGQRFATFLASVASTDPACPAVANTLFVAERAVYAGANFESGHVISDTVDRRRRHAPAGSGPGEAGALTIEGIDSNQNAVRDDVERYIALADAPPAVQQAMTDAAVALQEALAPAPTQAAAVEQATEVLRTIDCVAALDPGGLLAAELVSEVNNTYGRSEAYVELNQQVAGQAFQAGNGCSAAVLQALPAAQRAALLANHAVAAGLATAAPLPAGWTQVAPLGRTPPPMAT